MAKNDSIIKAREDSVRLVRLSKQKDEYIKSHDWKWVPIDRERLTCSLCDKTIYREDSLFCVAYKNDSLYHVSWEDFALGETCGKVHRLYVPSSLKSNEHFKYHFEVYGDSLRTVHINIANNPELFNAVLALETMEAVQKKAPYGYFDEWGWGNEYGAVSFYFKYTNTSKKAIKYIDVYWKISNAVKDVRRTGHCKGTGPLAEWESGSWNWDYTGYYAAGDASYMEITKVIITYMNGSQKVLTGSMIKYN